MKKRHYQQHLQPISKNFEDLETKSNRFQNFLGFFFEKSLDLIEL